MKSAIILGMFAILSLSAQAAQNYTCFKNGRTTGMIELSSNRVYVDWDLKSKANDSKENGWIANLTQTANGLEFTTYLQGVGDGSDYKFTISASTIKVQPLWSNGTPVDSGQAYKRVACPF